MTEPPRDERSRPEPPEPLAEKLRPSIRHPEGLPRCQRWGMKKGAFWQCRKAARLGFPVCPSHGAGYAHRERTGRAQNPKLSSIKTGDHAQAETLNMLFANHPGLRRLFEAHLASGRLFDFRPALAAAKALTTHYLGTADLKRPETALAGVDALLRVVRLGASIAEVQERLGPITLHDLQQIVETFSYTIVKFVPAEQLAAARRFCMKELTATLPHLLKGTGDSAEEALF